MEPARQPMPMVAHSSFHKIVRERIIELKQCRRLLIGNKVFDEMRQEWLADLRM
ncbi:hypothetical protein [Nitrospira sp. Nam74]